ncbi:hypothetical protein DSCO28_30420 [Desulfosarcina ovata subsp. sediminis]|uniref:Uncharacterized protein n=2 Tax=Desulfosarcina ovata TaxID=83564 RepID=A0A5K7ZMM0_9BACT|nr:hypothetical protein DSCO28_30420 [Desulfosarcina ovata subsp. sediminis]
MTESIIETVRDKSRPANEHIAHVTGMSCVPKAVSFRDKENGEAYYSLAGSLAYPAVKTPGFGVIIAVLKNGNEQQNFKVLAETEAQSIDNLLDSCLKMCQRWGFPESFSFLYGDPERFLSALTDFNLREENSGLYLAPPNDFQQPNRTEIYLQRIRSALGPNKNGQKGLHLGNCDKLRAYLQNFPTGAAKIQIEDFPAVAALGYGLHSLAASRPWMESTDERISYADRAEVEQQQMFDALGYTDAEVGYFDDGDTIGTL